MDESRRSFLKKAGASAALFTILPRHVFGAMGGDKRYVAPSDQLTKGIIGVGGIGRSSNHFTSDGRKMPPGGYLRCGFGASSQRGGAREAEVRADTADIP